MSVGGRGTTNEEILAQHKFSGAGTFNTGGAGTGDYKPEQKFTVPKQEYTITVLGSGGINHEKPLKTEMLKNNTRIYHDLTKASDFALGLEAGGIKNIYIVKVEDHWEVRYV